MNQPSIQQCAALQSAVDAVNAAIRDIRETCGPSAVIHPIADYDTDRGFAEIKIEITTGRLVFGS